MDQLNNYADSRLINGCIYCGAPADTRDHVPSKCLLEAPYPTNLPVVGCCDACNQSFSIDEEYFVCLIESALCGSTDPAKISRRSVARKMEQSISLRKRIEDSRRVVDGQSGFFVEIERVEKVMLKLARGHAAFELSQICNSTPDHFWCGTISSLSQEDQNTFHSVHFQEILGEIGSRNQQRLIVMQMTIPCGTGEQQNVGMLINDWIDVQDKSYRYIAIDDMGMLIIRIVIAEFYACEVSWGV